jgi:ubiquinone/menaquinone biosynthesis C-methylase UbiE
MASDHVGFVGSVPEIYERHMGPVFFVPYARDLARRVVVPPRGRVLEIACGTGMLTRHVAATLDPSTSITATDLNDAMLAVARTTVNAPNVEWKTADATALPFADRSFDAVVCQFGVMFFPDRVAAAREVRRVLRPGGSFWFSVWNSLDENPIGRIPQETIAGFFDAGPPTFYEVPFGYHDRAQIASDLRAAGFGTIDVHQVDLDGHAVSADSAALGIVQGTPMVAIVRERANAPMDAVTAAVSAALAREYGTTDLRIPLRAMVVHAR